MPQLPKYGASCTVQKNGHIMFCKLCTVIGAEIAFLFEMLVVFIIVKHLGNGQHCALSLVPGSLSNTRYEP
ncbi:hypothetical protein XELAEV_18023507mg [Xenopus laevis]|uniref:Uncharacterized protein n=1 Tax=Xenopus laevis TaxID=8355 RepID=A0A974HPD9_XENLA|nr:hypothetical protein XELAEV_18023507mg [Xenopus laevis]